MMNFKNIQKYSNYQSYQRIKRIKHQQCNRGLTKSKCKHTSYQDYLDKKDGFVCCPIGNKKVNCMYTGILGKTPCLTATLHAVEFSPGKVGFDGQGHGSLLPGISWDGSTVISFVYHANFWSVQFNGNTEPVFYCIELTQNNKTIRLFMLDGHANGCSPPGEGATHHFCWAKEKVEPSNSVLTTGAWTFRLCLTC